MTAGRRPLTLLVAALLALVLLTAVLAVLADDGGAPHLVTSVRGETVQMYGGVGPYAYDTVTRALMQRAFDVSYLAVQVPMALVGLVLYLRGKVTGLVLLASTLLAVCYAFLISSIGMSHNQFFLAYVAGVVLSGWAVLRLLGEVPADHLAARVVPRLPVRTVAAFVLLLAAYFVVSWLAVDIAVLVSGDVHPDVEIYTTADQNVTDLAVYATASVWAGTAALRRRPHGTLVAAALVLMAAQILLSLTLYTFTASSYRGTGAAGVEWPLPIAAAACLVVGGMVLLRLRGVPARP